ncbi:TPA: hypothetical protein H7V03_004578 [Escherichia coli]|nr:hypothetical protein [Escherichia coli]HAL9266673.1 hypothetical protein [Escherichia coli]HAL9350356.1 hypothetical protein [Escherichia coli]
MTGHAAILDMCCGSRMFWFDTNDERAIFSDIRKEEHTLCDGQHLIISPDLIADSRALPFADASFSVVVFDPPHLERVGDNACMGKTITALITLENLALALTGKSDLPVELRLRNVEIKVK